MKKDLILPDRLKRRVQIGPFQFDPSNRWAVGVRGFTPWKVTTDQGTPLEKTERRFTADRLVSLYGGLGPSARGPRGMSVDEALNLAAYVVALSGVSAPEFFAMLAAVQEEAVKTGRVDGNGTGEPSPAEG
ncbi:MAG: hypothetical protein M3167_06065 [Acidobacteriota bacterium]|nr:hypothetical protein [Acidobacteriota bacterium]